MSFCQVRPTFNGCRDGDAWLVLNGRALNVIDFLLQHPDGNLATLTVTDKDATAGYDMRHPPFVVEKCASGAVIGVNGTGGTNRANEDAGSVLPAASIWRDVVAILEVWEDCGMVAFDDAPGVLSKKVRTSVNACHHFNLSTTYVVGATNLSANDQAGPT